jgi:hypothetical protein
METYVRPHAVAIPAHPRLPGPALVEHDLAALRRVARELPGVVTLTDALQVLLLMLEGDDPAFDAAAVRWINRFTG